MAVNFPSNPTNGQTITASGITYAYDSTQGVWSDSPQGLTQAIDALTDVDTSTSAPSNGQTLQWNSTDSEWQPADSSAGVTVYATIDDLPLTGIAEGSMALVDSTDKLYIFSDSGWYSISIVNTTPSISGVSATYTLATDGTATTVTVSATDPEGLPLTYSIVSDTSGNVATVAQGTGSNTNQWTITPTTNTANGGNFTLVFRASDGVNIASASSTFSLVFVLAIPNSQYTSALFTSVGANNAVNDSFDDASTNNHTITASGDVTQSTFSPYRHGGYSTYFDGSGDYLTVSSSQEHDFGTGDFCVEFWWWPETVAGLLIPLSAPANSTTQLGFDNAGGRKLYFYNANYGGNIIQNTSATPTVKAWNHIALCRSGTTVSLYLNGTRAGTATHSSNVSFSGLEIGRYNGGGYEIDGYVRDVRLVKGSSIYNAVQTSLTVPTEPLTAVTNTTFLGCHLPYIADGSTNSLAITVNGNTKTEPFGPFEYQEYSSGTNGGSMYFDGSGDRLQTPTHSSLTASGDFTVEMWIHPQQIANPSGQSPTFFAWNAANFMLYITASTGILNLYSGAVILSSTSNIKANRWTHVAIARDSGTTRLFVNGVSEDSTTSYSTNPSGRVVIGSEDPSGYEFGKGSIADVRLVNGTAVYTSAFTPPTAPLTAITNTSLLLNGTGAGIIDKSQSVKTFTLNGNTKSSTTQTKYLSSSMYFDGTGDYVSFTSDLYGWAGDFTIEAWVYHTSFGPYSNPIYTTGANTSLGADFFELGANSGGAYQVFWGSSSPLIVATAAHAVPVNTWSHIALTRSGSTLRLYLNGSQSASTTKSGALPSSTTDRSFIGTQAYSAGASTRSFYGYMSDVRLTKGLARYTSSFTAPTDALEG